MIKVHGGDQDNRGHVISVANGATASGFGSIGDIGTIEIAMVFIKY
jgi:hypothetical protein